MEITVQHRWNEVRVHSTANQENTEFRRQMNEINESIINTSNFYEVSFHNILEEIANENESELHKIVFSLVMVIFIEMKSP